MAFLNVGLLNLQVYCGFFKNILTCDVQQNTSEKAELSEKRESKRVHKGLN